jgi:hypothetical protein
MRGREHWSSIPAAPSPCADVLLDRHDSGGGLLDIPDRRTQICVACATGGLWTIAARQAQIRRANDPVQSRINWPTANNKVHRTPATKDGCRKRKQTGALHGYFAS